ncbi:MAG: thiamine-phosphate kinase [Theionarchaea archaeon]|nr:thiamine-phosphate kinase [Theionarchaea archaeon]
MKERELIHNIIELLHIENEDAFVFSHSDSLFSLTIDTLVARTDVPRGMTPVQVGWKSVVMNLSDLAAMGAAPRYFLCSVTAPEPYPVFDLVKGIKHACDQFECLYVGGDLNEGELSVSGVAVGISRTVMLRSGARPGDKVGVTGDVGRVYAGLKALDRASPAMKKKIFSPLPRIKDGLRLRAHACIDISDGLSSELYHLAAASGVSLSIYSDLIPVHADVKERAETVGENPVSWALKSGEEYELVFTDTEIDPEIGTEIGEVTSGTDVLLDGEKMPLLGWEHYS